MGGYVAVPVTREPVDAQETMTEVFRQAFPSWKADAADPMTAMRDAAAVLYSDCAGVASRVGEEVFRFYGRSLADVPPVGELAATGSVLITAQDTNGPYVVPEGLEVEGRNALGEPVGFFVPAQAIIPNGVDTITVAVEALEEGADLNGITGDAEFLSNIADYLTSVEFVGATVNGRDDEGDDEYLDRLHEELKLSSPRPILPPDFAVLARRFGAYRATYVDGLDPVAVTTGNLATVSVAMQDATGAPLGAVPRDAIVAQLDAMREVGWRVFGLDPDVSNTISVQYAATAYPDVDTVATKAAADAAIADLLDPLVWGSRRDTGQTRVWFNEDTVRWGEVYDRIMRVEQIRYVSSLGLKLNAGSFQATGVDLTMSGYVPLPQLGTITGTVS